MKNMKMEKTAKAIDVILKILQGFMIGFGIAAAVFIVLAFVIGEDIVIDASLVDFGDLSLRLQEGAVPGFDALRTGLVIKLAAVIVMMAAGWYLMHVVRQVLVPMKEGRPFEEGTARKISKLAWTEMIAGAVIEGCRVFGQIAELKGYDIGQMINPETVLSYDYTYAFRYDFIIVGLILLFVALIFKYGENLQQEADETL